MLIGHINSPFRPLADEFAFAAENGFDFLELTVEPPHARLESISSREIKRLSRLHRLPVPIGHGIWYLPYAHPVEVIRRACRAYWDEYLTLCFELGITAANIHTNFSYPRALYAEVLENHFEFLAGLVEAGREKGVKIMLEPVGDPGRKAEMTDELLKGVDGLYLHLDLGHLHMAEDDGGIGFIRRHRDKILHVHVSDNNGLEDQHLPIGCGTVDFPTLLGELKQAGYEGAFTLEIFAADREYLVGNREKLRRLWEQTR